VGSLAAVFAIRHVGEGDSRVAVDHRNCVGLAGLAFLLFGALNFFTQIGPINTMLVS